MGLPLIDQVNLVEFVPGTTGGTGSTTPILDMTGYEGILFLAYAEATNASIQLFARGGTATADMSELTGPEAGEATGVAPSLYLDVYRPKERYIEGVLMCGSGGAGNSAIVGLRYGARALPTTNSTLWHGLALATPNSGTASASG